MHQAIIPIASRQSKYCQAIAAVMQQRGHASNAELIEELRHTFPDVSATTVHRATARLASRGELATAPSATNGDMRYDAKTTPHDHFLCGKCGILRDVDIAEEITKLVKSKLAGCGISGRVTISGTCKECNEGASKS